MSTTELFVELLVIGAGAVIAAAIATLGLCGHEWVVALEPVQWLVLLPVVATTYVLGIIVDRLADLAFEGWLFSHRARFFKSVEEYQEARYDVLMHGDAVRSLQEYGRSRLRICRGWTLNSVLIFLAAEGYALGRLGGRGRVEACLVIGAVTLTLGIASAYATRRLALTDLRKTAHWSRLLRERGPGSR